MNRTIHGKGTLRSISVPRLTFKVQYYFEITSETIEQPGFPSAASRSISHGRVEALSEVIPGGFYDLETEKDGTLRVSNLSASDWYILSPV
jgi:hypothetical protein